MPEPEDPPALAPSEAERRQVIEPDLLWVESVTERLLGPLAGQTREFRREPARPRPVDQPPGVGQPDPGRPRAAGAATADRTGGGAPAGAPGPARTPGRPQANRPTSQQPTGGRPRSPADVPGRLPPPSPGGQFQRVPAPGGAAPQPDPAQTTAPARPAPPPPAGSRAAGPPPTAPVVAPPTGGSGTPGRSAPLRPAADGRRSGRDAGQRARHAAPAPTLPGEQRLAQAVQVALRSGDPTVVDVVAGLARELAVARDRLRMVEGWLSLVLDEAADVLPGAALLRAILADDSRRS